MALMSFPEDESPRKIPLSVALVMALIVGVAAFGGGIMITKDSGKAGAAALFGKESPPADVDLSAL